MAGEIYVTPLVGVEFASAAMENPADQPKPILTRRQREVLQLIAEGHAAKSIAYTLNISVKTAEFHRASIMEKLGLRSTAELTRYAIDQKMVSASN
jgi:Response regulator containing a CheY-like receiver domain and an HTH DNA-binding domain